MSEWFPSDKDELKSLVNYLLNPKENIKIDTKDIHGLIVPHAGYAYSGEIAGKAFSLLKSKPKKVVILSPNHYSQFKGIASLENLETPLGKVKIIKNMFPKTKYEHAILNQIPFLQLINPKIQVLPLIINPITIEEARQIARMLLINYPLKDYLYVISTDLSHFHSYNEAIKLDQQTTNLIQTLTLTKETQKKIDACGIYPLMVFIELAKLKKLSPTLIEYKNSGDITGDKSSVVGYSSWVF